MKRKQYIVMGAYGPQCLMDLDDGPRAGVLMNGDTATVFRCWHSAMRAIMRTTEYASDNDLKWDWDRLRIWPVRFHPQAAGEQRKGTP